MSELGEARDAGRQALAGVRRTLAERLATLLRRDEERLGAAVEMGLVRREWLDAPGDGQPISVATPLEVLERFLERSVEQRPSLLATLGLTALQVLSAGGDVEAGTGVTMRLAVVFTDLVNFTRFTANVGDEAASRLLAEHHKAVGPIVRSGGGRVVKRLGDGLLLTFPEPEAAVLACLELTGAPPGPLHLRAGVHVGEVLVSRDDIIGHVVNVAARVTEVAKGDEVLVTAPVWDAVASLPTIEAGRHRRRTFKGVGEAVDVVSVRYRDTSAGAGESRRSR